MYAEIRSSTNLVIDAQPEPGSFRDLSNRIFYHGEDVYRALDSDAVEIWQRLKQTKFFAEAAARGDIVAAILTNQIFDRFEAALKVRRLPLMTHPYEWTFGMLKDAALLTLDLLTAALREDWILKDATPYNVQWLGAKPVFIDHLSFRPLRQGEAWQAYQQFCQMFLYPLFLTAYKGVGFQPWLRGSLEGIPVDDAAKIFRGWDLRRPGVFMHVTLQAKFKRALQRQKTGVAEDLQRAGFQKKLIENNVRKLRRVVERLHCDHRETTWVNYGTQNFYGDQDLQAKEDFVRRALQTKNWKTAWDLGCNHGGFSRMASLHAENVVAIDQDLGCLEAFYHRLQSLPDPKIQLVYMDLADPSPDQGWNLKERRALLARSQPELILCLAVIHHIVLSRNVPVEMFLGWLQCTARSVILEIPHRDDPAVQGILSRKDIPHSEYGLESLEKVLQNFFEIRARQALPSGTRTLYFLNSR